MSVLGLPVLHWGLSLVVAMGGPLYRCGGWVSHWSGFSCCKAQALGHSNHNSLALEWLSSCGTLTKLPWGMWNLPRNWPRVPCIGRWILNHWTSWEVPHIPSLMLTRKQGPCYWLVCALSVHLGQLWKSEAKPNPG